MKKLLLLIIFVSCSHAKLNSDKASLKVVHYNIKEFSNQKIKSSNQLENVKSVLKNFDFDILSLNEVQYDLPNGKNLDIFAKSINKQQYKSIFFQANTGNKAKKLNGSYLKDFKRKDSRSYADALNFGIMPGQYSTGALVSDKIKVLKTTVITDLKWIEFNQKLNLNKFRGSNNTIIPNSIELFDKNFTDALIEVNGKKVHLILLHTVPAFHFGNKKSMNYQRNADQLKFLEWYLTGHTDFKVNLKNITPLANHSRFIAMGDWNTELNHPSNPGSKVLRRLFKKINIWVKNPGPTNESSGHSPTRLKLSLDYIAYSKGIKLTDAGIYRPENKNWKHSCDKQISSDKKVVSYFNYKKKKKCFSETNNSFQQLKKASDHFPIWANFNL